MMKQLLSTILFDESCLHCGLPAKKIFCSSCAELLELLDPTLRCKFCFSPLEDGKCAQCHVNSYVYRRAALFSPMSPMKSLIHEMKKKRLRIYLEAISAYFFLQYEKLNWSVDLITAFPSPVLQKIYHGENIETLLARGLAARLGVPYKGVFSVLSKESLFPQINRKGVQGKDLLLISLEEEKSHLFPLKQEGVRELYSLSLFEE